MKFIITSFIIFTITCSVFAQDVRYKDKENGLSKVEGIEDRAAGTHNASNIGLFFENRGKLYPRRITQGPSGEFPINSGKHYIFRVAPFVGLPDNVIQARHTTNEEWEAVGGYHNNEFSQVAFSDNPATWPASGWPIKDADGNPIIKSDQDSYCVFDDLNNSRLQKNIQVAQTGYTYGVAFAQNLIFLKYDVTNNSNNTYNDLYFAMYTDIDVGNISGGAPEYADDKIDFIKEKNLLYFYDDGVSNEWPENTTGYFGLTFLKTPEINGVEAGITDMHYFLYFDDQGRDIDSIQYGIMSSAESLYNSDLGDRYFHLGNNSDLSYDDPQTIPEDGLDIVAMSSSGPYTLAPGETITFYTALVAGEDLDELMASYDAAVRIKDFDFEISKPPATPTLNAFANDSKVTLYWDDAAESSRDNFSGLFDFEGYKLYRSQDKGVSWNLIEEFDLVNDIGFDVGLEYSYTDNTVVNGFEYWYSITAYDRGDESIESLESSRGSNTDSKNLTSVIPNSDPLGYNPVSSNSVEYTGSGNSNYVIEVQPEDNNSLVDNTYKVKFDYVYRKIAGNLNTEVEFEIRDPEQTNMNKYRVEWLSNRRLQIFDFSIDDYIQPSPKSYLSGAKYNLNSGLAVRFTDPDTGADPDLLPQENDFIAIDLGVYVEKNDGEIAANLRPLEIGNTISTYDGVILSVNEPETIQDISKVGGTDNFAIEFSVDDQTNIQDGLYLISIEGNGSENSEGFVNVIVRNNSQEIVLQQDSLFNRDSFYFDGIRGRLEFNPDSPPSAGNIFSITVVVPNSPNILDEYTFTLQGSSIDQNIIKENISNIRVVPNPYVVSSLYEPEFGELRREPLRQIQFINLPTECTIYIFTVDADLVKTINHSSLSGTITWDLRAEGGREIAPGVYMYVVQADGVEYKNRFAIIK